MNVTDTYCGIELEGQIIDTHIGPADTGLLRFVDMVDLFFISYRKGELL